MIQGSAKKMFDIIIVWKLDRFAHNRYDSARYKALLKKMELRLYPLTKTLAKAREA